MLELLDNQDINQLYQPIDLIQFDIDINHNGQETVLFTTDERPIKLISLQMFIDRPCEVTIICSEHYWMTYNGQANIPINDIKQIRMAVPSNSDLILRTNVPAIITGKILGKYLELNRDHYNEITEVDQATIDAQNLILGNRE
jgi:hypothetical protein